MLIKSRFAPSSTLAKGMKSMDVSRSCKIDKINWGSLPELKARLEKKDIFVDYCSVLLNRFPDEITYNSLEEAVNDVKNNDLP